MGPATPTRSYQWVHRLLSAIHHPRCVRKQSEGPITNVYLDDIRIYGDNEGDVKWSTRSLRCTIEKWGLKISQEKSVLDPTPRIMNLGVPIDLEAKTISANTGTRRRLEKCYKIFRRHAYQHLERRLLAEGPMGSQPLRLHDHGYVKTFLPLLRDHEWWDANASAGCGYVSYLSESCYNYKCGKSH
ncbi:uncharacterized protein LOC135926061 [Gordionus sp. m RMFG-2023]|uniref:uncharacterized protein LOC135926061 n=1 Tax=Gordionus sp. m RMFG-2023 TaxID=3053472 RepID=UPI0031FCB6D1